MTVTSLCTSSSGILATFKASSVSYGVTLGDFTNNGFLDILISNSGSRNIIYFNQSK